MTENDNHHQIFEKYDKDHVLICRWTMDKIERKDSTVWIMNHFFVNPKENTTQILDKEMPTALKLAQKSALPIWPLDPVVIAYFAQHQEFAQYWYHRPFYAIIT